MRAHEFTDQGAAGIVLYAEDTGRYGLQQRSNDINDPGLWAAWGGGREPGESLEQCARRELSEEGGYTGPIKLHHLASNPKYTTFIGVVPHEFEPQANDEWKDYCWTEAGDWPSPMHPGVAAALENITMNENFADGKVKGKSRPGRVKRAGASCNGSVTDLRQRAKNASGEKARMYHWCANMKSGKKK
jgi:8-oxo-dGTP pyrophosphatase MutT (NUDIX family)